MPKQTFLNLTDEKRQALIDIAVAEFAENDYTAASVSKIVERAGIAKGSIYQYFDDKQEMFIFLVEHASQRLLAALASEPSPAVEEDFFTDLRRQMSASVRVNMAHPQLSRLLRRSAQAPAVVREELMKRLSATSTNHFFQLILRGVERGDLKANLDPVLATGMISAAMSELGTYIQAMLGIDAVNSATLDLSIFDTPQVEEIYDSVIDILRTGLARQ